MKVQISMDDSLLHELDEYADKHFQSRSGVIAQAVSQVLYAERTLKTLQDFTAALQTIAKKTDVPKEDIELLNVYAQICQQQLSPSK